MSRPPRITWWQVVASYPCPTCGAGPGELCTTESGKVTEAHAPRSRLAARNGWRFREDVERR